jgi:transposase
VHRYNETGLEGLKNQPNTGAPPRKLTPDQEAIIADLVRQGPDLEEHNELRVDHREHWGAIDVCRGDSRSAKRSDPGERT